MSEVAAKVWSDLDGTAVALARGVDPRRMTKYPLLPIRAYAGFLSDVVSTGVELAVVVTRRPNLRVRRWATTRSIANLGYSEFFPRPDQIVHTGGEKAKGEFLAQESRSAAIGMLEDKPHKLGEVLLGAL